MSGVYDQSYTSITGCDSTIQLTLDVHSVDILVNTSEGSLGADATDAVYQWIDCTDSSAILGATEQSFTPAVSGTYAVIVNDGSCKDTSACFNLTIDNIAVYDTDPNVKLFPNPADNALSLLFNEKPCRVKIIMRDITGKPVLQQLFSAQNTITLNIENLAPGLYFITLDQNGKIAQLKFIKMNKEFR